MVDTASPSRDLSAELIYEYRPEQELSIVVNTGVAVAFPVLAVASIAWFVLEVRRQRRATRNALCSLGFSILLPLLAVDAVRSVAESRRAADRSTWISACGPVTQFATEERGNTGHESFVVGATRFEYADSAPPSKGYGYRRTKGRGGALDAEMMVRIDFVTVGDHNVIVRVERFPEGSALPCGERRVP
jgi:hypothetical protein